LGRLQEKAKCLGFAAAEVQISETETPLHRLETVYRRLVERLSTNDSPSGAFRTVLNSWFYALEQDVISEGDVSESDAEALMTRTSDLMERRLSVVTRRTPTFAAVLRAYRTVLAAQNRPVADGLVAWLSGDPNVAPAVKRTAGVKGEMNHFAALSFLQGLLLVLRDSGYAGLVLVLDEVETLQRVRGDVRDKGLNALRQIIGISCEVNMEPLGEGRQSLSSLRSIEKRRSSSN
jgi:hypothetical protein